MNQRHYFTNNDDLKSKRKEVSFRFLNHDLKFISDEGVFSKDSIDYGSKFLLECVSSQENVQSLLDMGCGYGLIGIALSKHFNIKCDMVDINQRALNLAKENVILNKVNCQVYESNLFENVESKYDCIVTNPPIRAGKKVIYSLFEEASKFLNEDGTLWIVIRKQHGAESAIKFLNTIYQKVEIIDKSKGFWVIKSTI